VPPTQPYTDLTWSLVAKAIPLLMSARKESHPFRLFTSRFCASAQQVPIDVSSQSSLKGSSYTSLLHHILKCLYTLACAPLSSLSNTPFMTTRSNLTQLQRLFVPLPQRSTFTAILQFQHTRAACAYRPYVLRCNHNLAETGYSWT